MTKFYLFLGLGGMIIWAFYMGQNVAKEKCNATLQTQKLMQQTEIIKLKEKVNEDVFNTDTDDIRRILCKKYSIAK